MIRVDFHPSRLQAAHANWWSAWKVRAEQATVRVIAAWETSVTTGQAFRPNFQSSIWTEWRDRLMENVFYERCAYCERPISGYYGDAEHFRPKSAVTCEQNGTLKPAMCRFPDPFTGKSLEMPHPGYFWLAYNWRNLVPACVFCNSGPGKNAQFETGHDHVFLVRRRKGRAGPGDDLSIESPTWPGYYYPAPRLLDRLERPLFLYPLNPGRGRDPHLHIRFGVRGRIAIVEGSDCAASTIKVFRLNEDKITRARQKAQENFQSNYFDALRNPRSGSTKAEAILNAYRAGRHPFAAAALDYHAYLLESLLRKRN